MNTLWITSLILSLVAALYAIIVKQWLREYIQWTDIMPIQRSLNVRQRRHEAFGGWRVPEIIAMLPILLQLALVLFLCGLIDLLWVLQRSIAYLAVGTIVPAIFLAIVAVLLSVLIRDCPFRSPSGLAILHLRTAALGCLRVYNWTLAVMGWKYLSRHYVIRCYARLWDLGLDGTWNQQDVRAMSWEEFDRPAPPGRAMLDPQDTVAQVIRKEVVNSKGGDGSVFTWIYTAFHDDDLLRRIIPCFRDIEPRCRLLHLLDATAASLDLPSMVLISENYNLWTSDELIKLVPDLGFRSHDDRKVDLRQRVMQRHKRLPIPHQKTQLELIFSVLEYESDLDRLDKFYKRTRHDGSFVDALALLTLIYKAHVTDSTPSSPPLQHSHNQLGLRYIALMMKLLRCLSAEQRSWGYNRYDPQKFIERALDWIQEMPVALSKPSEFLSLKIYVHF